MNSSDFLELLRALTHLSSTQLERAQQHIQHCIFRDDLASDFGMSRPPISVSSGH